MHNRKALAACLLCLVGAGCSDDDDDSAPPIPSFGPSAIAVGDDGLVMVSDDMLEWTEVTAAVSGLPAAGDIVKVVKVPDHDYDRLVALVNRGDTDDSNAEIWFNDAEGLGSWQKADYGSSDSNLDPRHKAGAADDDWDLRDVFFVDANEGYAVGDRWIVLRTWNAGSSWTDMNAWSDPGPPQTTVLMDVSNVVSAFSEGETVTGSPSAADGTVVSWNQDDGELIVAVTTGQFSGADNLVGGTSGATADVDAVAGTWERDTASLASVTAVRSSSGLHTVFLGAASASDFGGIWRLVSGAASGSSRTFEWHSPSTALQAALEGWTVNGLYFFDSTTGVAGTGDGVWHTADGLTWTNFASTAGTAFHGFAYSSEDTQASGWLYSVGNSATPAPGRVAVAFAPPGTWTLDTSAGWVQHGDGTKYDVYSVKGSASIFLYGEKIFVLDGSNSGEWGFGYDASAAVVDDMLWQDTSELNLGGDPANGLNPAYTKGILDAPGAPVSTLRSMCRR